MKQIKIWITILLVFSLCFCILSMIVAIDQLRTGKSGTMFLIFLIPSLVGIYTGLALKAIQDKLKELEKKLMENEEKEEH